MENRITIKDRRFTCLTEGLVKVEFSKNAEFQDKRSIVAGINIDRKRS